MSAVIERERALYRDVFTVPDYANHSPGEANVALFLEMAGITDETYRYTVLDAGTGSGKGALALEAAKFSVRTCDLDDHRVPEAQEIPFAHACLWNPLTNIVGYTFGGKVDYVYCCDVMEHIPTEFTMLAASRMLDVARRGLFLSISLVPDQFGVWVGQPLHQTIKPFTWWRDNLNAIGRVQEARDCVQDGLYLVVPR